MHALATRCQEFMKQTQYLKKPALKIIERALSCWGVVTVMVSFCRRSSGGSSFEVAAVVAVYPGQLPFPAPLAVSYPGRDAAQTQ